MNMKMMVIFALVIPIIPFLAQEFDIDYIITSKNLYEKTSYKAIFFDGKNNKLSFLVGPNTTKEYRLSELCYIRVKNNRNIIFNPIPRVDLITGEIIASGIENVINSENLVIKNPVWTSNKLQISILKVKQVVFTRSERVYEDPNKDFIIFENGDLDKGTIETLEANKVLLNSEVYNKQKIYSIKDEKSSKYTISQIHFAEVSRTELEPETVYVVIVVGDGSKIIGKLRKISGGKLTVESEGLGEIEISSLYIHSIYTLNSQCQFLSDIPILSSKTFSVTLKKIKYNPTLLYRIKKDHSYSSSTGHNPISLAGEQFPKGLHIHSTTILKMRLEKKFTKLFSFYGIDDNILLDYNPTRPGGVVALKIYGDGKLLFKKNQVKLPKKLSSFTIDVSGVKILKIVVKEPPYPKYPHIFTLGRFSLGLPLLIK
ncbi:MAG: NPCBM/NEW2 domain-containing protein [Planctomycetota bacterium]